MDYREALAVLEARQETRIELGLERVRSHLRRLGDPQNKFPSIHVAGTNGKGSVCAILESVLRSAGYRTGFYASPHLFEVGERIRVAGEMIPPDDFARLLSKTLEVEEKENLTYFELLTSVAFQWFAERGVSIAVLETGLGGRLDATNVVESPLACAITSISLDHERFLGSTLAEIAGEKAGIIKKGVPVVCPALPEEAMEKIREKSESVRAPMTMAVETLTLASVNWEKGAQMFWGNGTALWELGLLGARQGRNVALCRTVLECIKGSFPVAEEAWVRGLDSVRWPFRFEVKPLGSKRIIVDGAHNPEAAQSLSETWSACPWAKDGATWFVGLMRDKNAEAFLSALAPHLRDVVCVRPPGPRGMEPAALAAIVSRVCPSARVRSEDSWPGVLGRWIDEPGTPTAVACGSFYLGAGVNAVLSAERSALRKP